MGPRAALNVVKPVAEPLLAPPEGRRWEILWNSNAPHYGGSGGAAKETEDGWYIAAESASVLRANSNVGAYPVPLPGPGAPV